MERTARTERESEENEQTFFLGLDFFTIIWYVCIRVWQEPKWRCRLQWLGRMEPKYVEQRSDRVTTTGCRFFDKTTISVVSPFVRCRIFRAFGRLPDESITRTVYTSATVHRIPRRHRVRRVATGAKSNLFSLGIPCICSHVSGHGNWTLSLEGNKFRLLSENWSRSPSNRRNVVSRTFSALKGRVRGTATEEACMHARVCVCVCTVWENVFVYEV